MPVKPVGEGLAPPAVFPTALREPQGAPLHIFQSLSLLYDIKSATFYLTLPIQSCIIYTNTMGLCRHEILHFADRPTFAHFQGDNMAKIRENFSPPALLGELELFSAGRCLRAWRFLGAHPARDDSGAPGCLFRLWAPNARGAAVTGDFNRWDLDAHPMSPRSNGVWEAFVPGLNRFDRYQFAVTSADGEVTRKADPFAFHADLRPGTASRFYDLNGGHRWGDGDWLEYRARLTPHTGPMNIYECHLPSWRRTGEGNFLNYRTLAAYLVPYAKEMGYTHVEFLPITEHPLDASWGYQCTGYFAATSRLGTPDDLKYLIDQLHQAGIGVIMDWVPAHFPKDSFGLAAFDGTPAFEYADPDMAEHPDWGTLCFDLGKPEVRSFLLSSALFWIEEFHIDALRVDAVSSMLYLNYSRDSGRWTPNAFGGAENLAAIEFLQQLNTSVRDNHPDVLMIAEESTAWPGVTRPVSEGGLGFHFKWNMGWMNDTCRYIKTLPPLRFHQHKDLTFPLMYAFSERYILPISHDEVVAGKGSYIMKMPGDDPAKFAGVRAFYAHMMTQPGKKLSFMGAEFGQWKQWEYQYSIDWHLLEDERHRQLHRFFKAMNAYYLAHPCLWEADDSWAGFEWLSADDARANTIVYLRKCVEGKALLVACNFSEEFRRAYRVGIPFGSTWVPDFSTDAWEFGGGGRGDANPVKSEHIPAGDHPQSLSLALPPMSCVIYRCVRKNPPRKPRALRKPRKNASVRT